MIVKTSSQAPSGGVWTPAVTFFNHENDTIDVESQTKYYTYLSTCGISGLVVLGTSSETFLLNRDERKILLETARAACGSSCPIMAGVSGHSTKQVLEYITDAAEAGADYALLLPPSYFGKLTTPAVIESFYADVANYSRLPIVIYNFPGVCNGIDLDSAIISRLAKAHSNIVGVKLTCGAVAKVTRLAAEFSPDEFACFAGQSDFLIGSMASGAVGTIAGFANVFPKTIVQIYTLYKAGKHQEALQLHQKTALAEQSCKAGITSLKYAAAITVAKAAGIEDAEVKLRPRRPYLEISEAEKRAIEGHVKPVYSIEASL